MTDEIEGPCPVHNLNNLSTSRVQRTSSFRQDVDIAGTAAHTEVCRQTVARSQSTSQSAKHSKHSTQTTQRLKSDRLSSASHGLRGRDASPRFCAAVEGPTSSSLDGTNALSVGKYQPSLETSKESESCPANGERKTSAFQHFRSASDTSLSDRMTHSSLNRVTSAPPLATEPPTRQPEGGKLAGRLSTSKPDCAGQLPTDHNLESEKLTGRKETEQALQSQVATSQAASTSNLSQVTGSLNFGPRQSTNGARTVSDGGNIDLSKSTPGLQARPALTSNSRPNIEPSKGAQSFIFRRQNSESLRRAQNELVLCGYNAPFVEELDAKHECPKCHHALRDPVQTDCGHRFCRNCIQPILK